MVLTYSGKSRPSALAIAEASDGYIRAVRGPVGQINWGRNYAETRLNPDISNSTNKRTMRNLFKEHGVPMPQLFTPYEAYRAVSGDGVRFVGRPDKHMKGRGFWLCNNQSDVDRAQQGTRRKAPATHFMEYVEADREYRVHIFNGKSIRISEKQYENDNVPQYRKEYTTIKPTGNVKHVRKAAKQAIKALGLDFGAVDVIVDKDENVYVLEVNSAPGIGGTLPGVYADAFRRWWEEEA